MTLPNPRIDETYEDYIMRSIIDPSMIIEYPNAARRLEVANSRWQETQLSRNFEVEVEEVSTTSMVATPEDSKGKTLPDEPEPLTDGEVQRY